MTISDLYPLKKHVLRRDAELPAEEVGAAARSHGLEEPPRRRAPGVGSQRRDRIQGLQSAPGGREGLTIKDHPENNNTEKNFTKT